MSFRDERPNRRWLMELGLLVLSFAVCEAGFNAVAWAIYTDSTRLHSEFAFIIELNALIRVPLYFLVGYAVWMPLRVWSFGRPHLQSWIASVCLWFAAGAFLGWLSTEISL